MPWRGERLMLVFSHPFGMRSYTILGKKIMSPICESLNITYSLQLFHIFSIHWYCILHTVLHCLITVIVLYSCSWFWSHWFLCILCQFPLEQPFNNYFIYLEKEVCNIKLGVFLIIVMLNFESPNNSSFVVKFDRLYFWKKCHWI